MNRLIIIALLLVPGWADAQASAGWFSTQIEMGRGEAGEFGAPRLSQTLGWYLNDDRSGSTVGLRLLGENNGGMAHAGGGPWYGYAFRLGSLVLAPTVGISYVRGWSTEPRVTGGLHAAEGYAALDVRFELGRLLLNARAAALRGFASRAGAFARGEAGLGVGIAF
jgi:hypothetical protein